MALDYDGQCGHMDPSAQLAERYHMAHGAVALVLVHGEDRDSDGHSEALRECHRQIQEVRRAGHMAVEQPSVAVHDNVKWQEEEVAYEDPYQNRLRHRVELRAN